MFDHVGGQSQDAFLANIVRMIRLTFPTPDRTFVWPTMNSDTPGELERMIATIWGKDAPDRSPEPDPETRDLENQALSIAIRLYLQSYLDDLKPAPGAAFAVRP